MATEETFWDPSGLIASVDTEMLARHERVEELTRALIEAIGEDPERPGLERTPVRVARAWDFLTAGYRLDLEEVVNGARFPAEGPGLVAVNDIAFASLCEHHLLPFSGRVHIGYLPGETIVGLSKLARITDMFARRLQVQERLTAQIAEALTRVVEPLGVAVVVEAEHMCMVMRGVEKPGSITTTTVMQGAFREDPALREEFLAGIARAR